MTRAGTRSSPTATNTTTTSTSASVSSPATRPRKRNVATTTTNHAVGKNSQPGARPDGAEVSDEAAQHPAITMSWAVRNQWIVLAVASGTCAAFNGVFAKLTTNNLTRTISQGISGFFGLANFEAPLEVVVRCVFFGLNLVFNGVMWTLFTQALAKGHSTTQVSIMNTSSNFMITAVLGLAIFSESLPPLWWVGAAMLVAGNVIIGRKDSEGPSADNGLGADAAGAGADDGAASAAELGESTVGGGGIAGVSGERYADVPQTEGVLGLPVEKRDGGDGEGEDDEDVPLIGDLDGPDGR